MIECLIKSYNMFHHTFLSNEQYKVAPGVSTPALTPFQQLAGDAVAFWKLDEATGTQRNDSRGENHLTDNGTISQITGKVGFAAGGTTGGHYLELLDNADMSLGTDTAMTLAGWVRFTSVSGTRSIIGKGGQTGGSATDYPYRLELAPVTQFRFHVSNNVSVQSVFASSFGTVPNTTWIFVAAWHDPNANTVNIQVNNGAVDSGAYSAGTYDDTGPFRMFRVLNQSGMEGALDAWGFWKRVLTSGERTLLYNNGDGLELP
jgi:hypothetical protein